MKVILLILVLCSCVLAGNILSQSGLSINFVKTYIGVGNQQAYSLICDGASGGVAYSVEGLPQGTYLDGDRIIVGNNTQSGNYILRITATDGSGNIAQRIVNLAILVTATVSSTSSSSNSVNVGGLVDSNRNLGLNGSFTGNTGNGVYAISGSGTTVSGTYSLNTGYISGISPNGGSGNISPINGGSFPTERATGSNTPSLTSTTSAASTSSTNSTQRLQQIISTYSTITDAPNVSYPGNTYPTSNLPTGTTSNLQNPTPIIISNQQAALTQSNRNTITADDVQLRAASQRHQNAIKAITNLLAIIDQARANQQQAQNQIVQYTNAYNQALANQKNVQSQIYSIEIKITQISAAINNITNQINQLNGQAGQNTAQRQQLVQQTNQLQSQLAPYNTQKQSIQNQIDSLNGQMKPLQDKLNANKANCDSLSQQVANANANLADLQSRYTNIDSIISNLNDLYNQKQNTVTNLQNQLNAAIAERDKAKQDLDKARSDKSNLPSLISQATQTLNQLQSQQNQCNNNSSSIQASIDTINANITSLTNQLATISNTISNIQNQINQITTQIAQYDSTTGGLNGQVGDLTNQLNFLKEQYTKTDTTRRGLYQTGNDANNQVAIAKQNLDAAVKRYQTETNNVNTGTQNLEKARSEEALARLGLEQLIARYTDALPYAIVPNGNGNTNPGTPAGNNPSGSPLGPIQSNGNGAQGIYQISSWTNYLSQAYGAGVNPAFSGSVTALYPFSFSSVVQGNTIYNNVNGVTNIRSAGNAGVSGSSGSGGSSGGNCFSNYVNSPSLSLTGSIVSVKDTSFDLRTNDGSTYTINVAPCTTLNSNKSGYSIRSGDTAVVKGYRQSSQSLAGQSITCLA